MNEDYRPPEAPEVWAAYERLAQALDAVPEDDRATVAMEVRAQLREYIL